MSTINIGGDNKDKSYRYKMPQMVIKIEGRGNGIKTVILNMHDLAKSLHTDPSYPTKYFGIELGAQSNYDRKTERAVVNGRHELSTLASHLEKFIDQFILCPNCRLPEIKMSVKKSNIKIDCAACGYNQPLKTAHRLATYIQKNPPDSVGKKSQDTKGKKKGKKGQDDAEDESENKGDNEEASGDNNKEDDKEAAAVTEVVPEPVRNNNVEWFTDTSKEAMKERQQEELKDEVVDVSTKKIQDLTKETPAAVLRLYLSQPRGVSEITSEVKRLQLARGLNDTQKVQALVQSVIDATEAKAIVSQFQKQSPLFAQFATDRASSTILINCIEEMFGVLHRDLIAVFPKVLQVLYDGDVLEEEAIVSWYDSPPETSYLVPRPTALTLRKRAKPLIDWFKNAEEDEEDDE